MSTSLWKFTTMAVYVLDTTEEYTDFILLREKVMYLMQSFVDIRDNSSDLKCLNFVQKYIQNDPLADIFTVDGHRISHQKFGAQAGNGL